MKAASTVGSLVGRKAATKAAMKADWMVGSLAETTADW